MLGLLASSGGAYLSWHVMFRLRILIAEISPQVYE
jgi:hypothetical protein